MGNGVHDFFQPPAGHTVGNFLGNLRLEIGAQQILVLAASLAMVALLVTKALVPKSKRPQIRLDITLYVTYIVSLFIGAGLLSANHVTSYKIVKLAGVVAGSWAIIGVLSLVLFDLAWGRFGFPRILRDLVTIVMSFALLAWILSKSGVNLLSIVTTSAVLTVVVGLALQDTLGNLLSGIALQLESSVTVGDWIRVDERQVGQVREIGWRSITVETRNGDLVTLPNALVTRGVITRFGKATPHREWVSVNVHLRHPPTKVQRILLDAMRNVPNVDWRIPPDCILEGFGDSFAKYSVRYRLGDYMPTDNTNSEVRGRLWYAMHRAGLEMPYPIHTVHLTEVTADTIAAEKKRERDKREKTLRKLALFRMLSDEERAALAAGLKYVMYAAGESVLQEGEPGDSVYLILHGAVQVRIGQGEHAKEISTLSEGQFVGEMSLLTGEPRQATVVALRDTEFYVLSADVLRPLFDAKPDLVELFSVELAGRQIELAGQREGLSEQRSHSEARTQLGQRIRRFFGLA